nr:hypothetical protein [Tanacetum cinerariifolium]
MREVAYTYYCQMKVNAAKHKLTTAGDGFCCWDGKKVVVNEASIRRDLRLDDAEGTTCLPNADIFKELEGMSKKKKRTHGLKRFYKIGLSARIVSSDEEGLGDQEDASKQGRIAKIDADKDLSLINDTIQDQGRINDQDLFGVHDLDNNEVFVDVTTGENVEQDATVAEKVVITIEDIEVVVVAVKTPQISNDKLTLAQTLMEIKAAKPKAKGVTIQEPSEFRTKLLLQPPQAKDKGKGIMLEPEKLLKKKDQIALDKEVARKLEAEMKAKIDESEQIQAQEREQLSIEEISKLLAELIESRRKYFAAKRAEEIRHKPPTKAQQKSLMCTYMKNMEGFKQKDFNEKSFDDIKKIAGEELEQESAKKQKLDEQVQAKVADDDTEKLKRCLEIVPEDDDDVAIEATPISSKSLIIVDYKIYKEEKRSYFKIIRADRNS